MSKVRLMGCDPGASSVRMAEVKGGSIVTAIVPAVVGVGDIKATGMAGALMRSAKAVPDRIAFGEVEYLVGENVEAFARPVERIDLERFTDGPELRALMYAALYRLIDGGPHAVALAIGMPVQCLMDKDEAARIERQLAGWLMGVHRFEFNGVDARIEVMNVRAKIPQPAGTRFNWGLDERGNWVRGKSALVAPTLVIDQGFSTLDVFAMKNGEINQVNTAGAQLGMRRACEIFAQTLERKYRIEIGLHEADELLFAVIEDRKALTWVKGEKTDVTGEARQALEAIGTEVIRFIDARVNDIGKYKVLITGGGALAIGKRLAGHIAGAEVMREPRLSNVLGLAKLAQREGFLVR
jgi:hypothetical protein